MASSRSTGLAVLRLLTVAGLGVEAYVHIHLAPKYDGVLGAAGISQGMLFRSVGAIAILMALLVLASTSRVVNFLAFLTAAGALAAVLLYHYGNPGKLGPLPDMHDPTWSTLKTLSAVAEGVATVTAGGVGVWRRGVPKEEDDDSGKKRLGAATKSTVAGRVFLPPGAPKAKAAV